MTKIINGEKFFEIYGKEENFHDAMILSYKTDPKSLKKKEYKSIELEIKNWSYFKDPKDNQPKTLNFYIVTIEFRGVVDLNKELNLDEMDDILDFYYTDPIDPHNLFEVYFLIDTNNYEPHKFRCKEIEIKSMVEDEYPGEIDYEVNEELSKRYIEYIKQFEGKNLREPIFTTTPQIEERLKLEREREPIFTTTPQIEERLKLEREKKWKIKKSDIIALIIVFILAGISYVLLSYI